MIWPHISISSVMSIKSIIDTTLIINWQSLILQYKTLQSSIAKVLSNCDLSDDWSSLLTYGPQGNTYYDIVGECESDGKVAGIFMRNLRKNYFATNQRKGIVGECCCRYSSLQYLHSYYAFIMVNLVFLCYIHCL